MKRLVVILFLAVYTQSFAQSIKLSNQAQFSILTLGPDQEEFYEAFGHSAIRLVDPVYGIDYAYNYGVFSFNQPNFYLNFAKGHLNYSLAIQSYPDFRDAYIYYNRFIHEQVLNLTPGQNQKIFDYLQWNARPENKYYLYDYFFNNCSTRIRDLFADLLKDDVHFDQSFIRTDYTIRQLTDLYLDKQPWGDLGIDIGLGSRIDRRAAPYEYMFLPDYLESSFDHASVRNNGITVPLVKRNITVFNAQLEADSPGWLTPMMALGFVLLVTMIITFYDLKKQKLSTWLDVTLFATTGFLGIVLLLLWFATDHHACAENANILWALPTNLAIVFVIVKKTRPLWLNLYFKTATAVAAIILVLWSVLPQRLNGFLYPFIAALLIRYFINWYLPKILLKRHARSARVSASYNSVDNI